MTDQDPAQVDIAQVDIADVELKAALGSYGRDLHALRHHAHAIAYYLGGIGVPRGETKQLLDSLVRAGVVDAYDDLVDG